MNPICLPFAEKLQQLPANLTVIGFGITEENESPSPVMLKVDMPVVTTEFCLNAYNAKNVRLQLTSKQFCVGGQSNKAEYV